MGGGVFRIMQRPPETFQTERLLLRPINETDAESVFFGYASSQVATRHMDWPRHKGLQQSVDFVAACVQAWNDGSAYPWAALTRSTGEFVGCIELRVTPPKARFRIHLLRAILAARLWLRSGGRCSELGLGAASDFSGVGGMLARESWIRTRTGKGRITFRSALRKLDDPPSARNARQSEPGVRENEVRARGGKLRPSQSVEVSPFRRNQNRSPPPTSRLATPNPRPS